MLRHHAGKVNLTHRNELSPASMFQHERGAGGGPPRAAVDFGPR